MIFDITTSHDFPLELRITAENPSEIFECGRLAGRLQKQKVKHVVRPISGSLSIALQVEEQE